MNIDNTDVKWPIMLQNEDVLGNFIINTNLGDLDTLPELRFSEEPHIVFESTEQDHIPKMETRGPPDRSPLSGVYDFSVEIDSTHTHKRKYVFSHKLNRIYVDMEVDFAVSFNWRGPADMFVRAQCVFADDAQAQKRVQRCKQHFPEASKGTADEVVGRNVLLSSRPRGTAGVYYAGDPNADDSWLSVCVHLNKRPDQSAAHAYRFACKNSCTSGINRRSTLLIFTLEDRRGEVHGRQVVGARVCSCPRRDMLKDEETEGVPRNKRKVGPAPPAPPAKVKREDNHPDYTLDLSTLHPQAAILGLECMIKMEMQADPNQTDARARDVIARLKRFRDEYKQRYPDE